jgi:hypothetical protein
MYAENGEGENRGVENKGREEVGLPFLRRRWQPGTGARWAEHVDDLQAFSSTFGHAPWRGPLWKPRHCEWPRSKAPRRRSWSDAAAAAST